MGNVQPGSTVSAGGRTVEIVKQLAEGGFAYVYLVRDVREGKSYAVKRIIVNDSEDLAKVKEEIAFMKAIPSHKNIVEFHSAQIVPSRIRRGTTEVYIMMEYCRGPSLYHILDARFGNYMTEMEVLHIFGDVCEAVAHLHSLAPPVAHRDIKVENVLKQGSVYKLCDFGSATSAEIKAYSRKEMNKAEEEIQRYTTMMYRSPEMIDLYQRKVINEKVDVWALGCLLYRTCFFRHPFEDGSNLAILNVNYQIPRQSPYSEAMHNLIKYLIDPDPATRPDMYQVLERVSAMRRHPNPISSTIAHFEQRRNRSFDVEDPSTPARVLPPSPLQGRRAQAATASSAVGASAPVVDSATALFDMLEGNAPAPSPAAAPAATRSPTVRSHQGVSAQPRSAPNVKAQQAVNFKLKHKAINTTTGEDMDNILFGDDDDDDEVPVHIAQMASKPKKGGGASAAALKGLSSAPTSSAAVQATPPSANGTDFFAEFTTAPAPSAPPSAAPASGSGQGSFFEMFVDSATDGPASPAAAPQQTAAPATSTTPSLLTQSTPDILGATVSPSATDILGVTTSPSYAIGTSPDPLRGSTGSLSGDSSNGGTSIDLFSKFEVTAIPTSPAKGHRRSVSEVTHTPSVLSLSEPMFGGSAAAAAPLGGSAQGHRRSPSLASAERNYSALHTASTPVFANAQMAMGVMPVSMVAMPATPSPPHTHHSRTPSAGAVFTSGTGSPSPARSPSRESSGSSLFESISGMGGPPQSQKNGDDMFSNLTWK